MEKNEHIIYWPIIVYLIGVLLAFWMTKKSYLQWTGEKYFDWSGRIPCAFFSLFSYVGLLVSFLLFSISGGFDKKK